MAEKTFPMTLEGKEKLEQELEELRTTKRAEIIERIKIVHLVTYLKTQNMNLQKMNKHLWKLELKKFKIC